ncbi:hypothetical protein ACP70R_042755 [Stipagrostis hirtigluma subsp. patula]
MTAIRYGREDSGNATSMAASRQKHTATSLWTYTSQRPGHLVDLAVKGGEGDDELRKGTELSGKAMVEFYKFVTLGCCST